MIEFKEEEEENERLFECIPNLWFLNESRERCYYPPRTGRTFQQRAIRCEKPNDDWSVYPCKVVTGGFGMKVKLEAVLSMSEIFFHFTATYHAGLKLVKEKCAQSYNTSSAEEHIRAAEFLRQHPTSICGNIEHLFKKNKPTGNESIVRNEDESSTNSNGSAALDNVVSNNTIIEPPVVSVPKTMTLVTELSNSATNNDDTHKKRKFKRSMRIVDSPFPNPNRSQDLQLVRCRSSHSRSSSRRSRSRSARSRSKSVRSSNSSPPSRIRSRTSDRRSEGSFGSVESRASSSRSGNHVHRSRSRSRQSDHSTRRSRLVRSYKSSKATRDEQKKSGNTSSRKHQEANHLRMNSRDPQYQQLSSQSLRRHQTTSTSHSRNINHSISVISKPSQSSVHQLSNSREKLNGFNSTARKQRNQVLSNDESTAAFGIGDSSPLDSDVSISRSTSSSNQPVKTLIASVN